MKSPVSSIESLVAHFEVYVKTTLELSKLKIVETLTNLTSSLMIRLIAIGIIAIFLLLLNIGVALLIGEKLGKSYYGFFIVAAFYLLAGIAFQLLFTKKVKKIVGTSIINQALE
jgi:hypothetical protein